MKNILGLILFVFFAFNSAEAYKAKIEPSVVRQGDAFVIKVSELKTEELPSAFFKKQNFIFNNCGSESFCAIGAVSIETKPGTYKIRLNIGNKETILKLFVKHMKFPTLFLTLPDEKVFLSDEDMKRAEMEQERLELIWQAETDKLWDGSFILPLENGISTVFGTKRIINHKRTSTHRGLDIKGKEGEEVRASNRGRVVLGEELFFGGNTVIIDHGQGIFTVYMHLSSINVKSEDIAAKGDVIGLVGSSGRASGPHLHFGVKIMETNVNPVSFVRLRLN